MLPAPAVVVHVTVIAAPEAPHTFDYTSTNLVVVQLVAFSSTLPPPYTALQHTACRTSTVPAPHSATMSVEDTQTEQPTSTSATDSTTNPEPSTSPDTAESVDASTPAASHPLHRSWTFWFSKPSTSATWGSALKQVTAIHTAEQLWSLLNAIKQPSQLQVKHDYYLFHSGIAPEWEDSQNKYGGKWSTQRHTAHTAALLHHCSLFRRPRQPNRVSAAERSLALCALLCWQDCDAAPYWLSGHCLAAYSPRSSG